MTVLFVRTYPLIDGSLTYKMRLAKKLAALGHHPYFVFSSNISEELAAEIKAIAPLLFVGELEQLRLDGKLPVADVMHAGVDGDGIPWVYDLKDRFFGKAAVVFGAWASNSFIHSSALGFSPDGVFYKYFLRRLPARNISFMGPTIKSKHALFSGRSLEEGPIVPNSLELPDTYRERSQVNCLKIVSVSRLSPSKEYVFATIEVLKKLRAQGINYEFHVYGSGEYLPELQQQVQTEQLESLVFLHGGIPYSEVNNALADAGYFIGMGAAIIEAAVLGIPSLQAIEYNKEPTVYGWFHELNDGEIGEYRQGKPVYPLLQFLTDAYGQSEEAYRQMCLESFHRAREFSIDKVIHRYLSFLKGADAAFSFRFPHWKRLLLKLARQPFKLFAKSPMDVIRKSR